MSDKESSLTIDGCLLPGIWLTQKGVDKAISRSKKFGVSTVTIGNSHHNGALAAYFPKIIDMGLIGISKVLFRLLHRSLHLAELNLC